jgi:hypothetical protein
MLPPLAKKINGSAGKNPAAVDPVRKTIAPGNS